MKTISIIVAMLFFATPAQAAGNCTKLTSGIKKNSGSSVFIAAPTGYTITKYCAKDKSGKVEYKTNPPNTYGIEFKHSSGRIIVQYSYMLNLDD